MKWITNTQLVAAGIPQTAIDEAVASGKLRGTRLTDDEMSFSHDAVDTWLAGCPDGVNAPGGIAAALRFSREQSAAAPQSPPRRPARAILDSVAAKIVERENCTLAAAKQRILEDDPALKARLIAEANETKKRS